MKMTKRARFETWMLTGGVAWLIAAQCLEPGSLQAASGVTAHTGQLELPTYPWWPAVKHPYFRGTDGRNIYPYPMLDNLSRSSISRTWRTVVLENEYLRVTFLPELGGRIYEVLDKVTGKPMFYVNHVVKPGLIGQCGAWISGGVEFNTGPAGHTVSAIQPIDVVILPLAPDGSRSVAVGEVERIYGTRWTVVLTLRPERRFLEETIRIYNLTAMVRPYYFWNCTAAPNTPGFRFIYPMTLGSDHSGANFYTWPIADGKDLSRGATYQDASSIFAYQCDQDFFGSYLEDQDRGVVAYANHHQLPGKKAWTWGHGSYGTMHQMDLTDTDGPYNEVQTGPLPTQADVGRLDPQEAVSWQEWWYPVHAIGGFTFANRELAANTSLEGGKLHLRVMGTGTWNPVTLKVTKDARAIAETQCRVSPRAATDIQVDLDGATEPFQVELRTSQQLLASFRVPLDLPVRQAPSKPAAPQTATELGQAGWQDFLFARFPEAEAQFRKALEKDPKSAVAQTGLAYVNLDRDPAAAAKDAQSALTADPDYGLARFVLAEAEFRQGHENAALDQAWKASLDPATAIPARALAAKIYLRRCQWEAAIKTLSEPGPWETDPVCRNTLALAWQQKGDLKKALQLAELNLADDPLDAFARSLVDRAGTSKRTLGLAPLVENKPLASLDLAIAYADLGQPKLARELLQRLADTPAVQPQPISGNPDSPINHYWIAYLLHLEGQKNGRPNQAEIEQSLSRAQKLSPDGVFPYHHQTAPVLRWALEMNPKDGQAALYLGHLLFSLGRQAEGRECWKRAAELGASPAIACRALGMASLNLDKDANAAAKFLKQAHEADPADAIVGRDLAQVYFTLAEKTESTDQKKQYLGQARDTLKAAFAGGQSRSDYVALLAKAQNRLGEYAATAKLLDTVRITIWEGAHEAHDLFEEAHLALGQAHLKEGHPAEALAEFDRALEYPKNLATGKMDNTPEAHIQYFRGNALAALGQKPAAIEAWKKAANEHPSRNPKLEEARKQAEAALKTNAN